MTIPPGVPVQSIYRFLSGTRKLSQGSIDALGKVLQLSLERRLLKDLRLSGPPLLDQQRKPLPIGTPLSDYLRRAVETSRKTVSEIARELGLTKTQLYRFLDKSRGLSQESLDKLCAVLGLVVEGPMPLRMIRRGAMMGQRIKYIPKPESQSPSVAEGGRQSSVPPKPPSLFVPPEGSPYGDN